MVETETDKAQDVVNGLQKAGVKQIAQRIENSDVVLKCEGKETVFSCQETSPKSRRKISKPKHYKPFDNGEENGEHSGIPQTPEDLNGSASSPESVVQVQDEEMIPENAVHVMTASHGVRKAIASPGKRSVPAQKPRRVSNGKSTPRKGRNDSACTVPRRPEDLIKEAMILGQATPPASKRDAQYRKSYAYKIWKEKGNQELVSDSTNEENGMSATKKKLPPGPLQNQARAAFYWPGNQYNGTTPPGFFANGKFYAINPQMIPAIHGRPEIPPTAPTAPAVPALTAATSVRTLQNSAIPSSTAGLVTSGGHVVQYPGVAISSGTGNPGLKVVPPNVTVVQQYSKERSSKQVKSPVMKSPTVKTPPLVRSPVGTEAVLPAPVSQEDAAKNSAHENGAKSSETRNEAKSSIAATASPSNLVSIMKNSLRQKHSKENVKPTVFKNKRKLETDKGDGPPAKKNGKPTIFTPLNEQEAEKLANDIYDVNLEYFPFQTLAGKAAQSEEASSETRDQPEKTDKVKEIEKVRCLLKDFYDVTSSCAEDPDMQKFDSASRKFGRKNILNHLSLLDRYFAELQKKLDT